MPRLMWETLSWQLSLTVTDQRTDQSQRVSGVWPQVFATQVSRICLDLSRIWQAEQDSVWGGGQGLLALSLVLIDHYEPLTWLWRPVSHSLDRTYHGRIQPHIGPHLLIAMEMVVAWWLPWRLRLPWRWRLPWWLPSWPFPGDCRDDSCLIAMEMAVAWWLLWKWRLSGVMALSEHDCI